MVKRAGLFIAASVASACLAGLLSACSGRGDDPVSVAQVAVKANPSLELVATDERQGVLTVKVKRTGQILTVHASDVVAGTAFKDLDAAAPSSSTVSAMPSDPAVAVTQSGRTTTVTTGRVSTGGAADGVSVAQDPSGALTVRTPGGTISVGSSANTAALAPRAPAATAQSSSPGTQTAPPARSGASPSDEPGAHIDESRLERRTRPVSCVGLNEVRLENVMLRVDEVAVQAAGGCNIRITNSHIAGRVALEAAGNTSFTIENSIIEGQIAIEAAGSARLSVKSSTVRGGVQKMQNATVRDLGQNLWR